MVSTIVSAVATFLLGLALIIEGPALITPTALMLAPTIGSTQTLQIQSGGQTYLSQHLSAGDRFISQILVQGAKSIGVRIDNPNGVTVRNETVGQEYVLDYKPPETGIYTIYLTSNSNATSYVLTRTLTVRSLLGIDATTVVGAVLAFSAVPVALRGLGYISLTGRRKLINPQRLTSQIPTNQAVMVVAPVCDEYETVVKSFLEDALKKGKSVFYVSLNASRVEELYKKYPGKFFALICDAKAAAVLQGAANVEISQSVADLTGLDITASKLLANIEGSATSVANLDIVSDVLLRHSLPLARKWLTQMLAKLKGKGMTVLAGVNPAMVTSQSVAGVVDLFDGHLEMVEIEDKQQAKRYLRWIRRPLAKSAT